MEDCPREDNMSENCEVEMLVGGGRRWDENRSKCECEYHGAVEG